MAKYHVIETEDFQSKLGAAGTGEYDKHLHTWSYPASDNSRSQELSSVALGGKIVAVSDDFFADVTNLTKVEVRLPLPLSTTDPSYTSTHDIPSPDDLVLPIAFSKPERPIWAKRCTFRRVGIPPPQSNVRLVHHQAGGTRAAHRLRH